MVPKFILPNFGKFQRSHLASNAYNNNKCLGKVAPGRLGVGMVYWLGKFRLVLLAIKVIKIKVMP